VRPELFRSGIYLHCSDGHFRDSNDPLKDGASVAMTAPRRQRFDSINHPPVSAFYSDSLAGDFRPDTVFRFD
jgi:hypothetical protein